MRIPLLLLFFALGCSSDAVDRSSLTPDFGAPPQDTVEDAGSDPNEDVGDPDPEDVPREDADDTPEPPEDLEDPDVADAEEVHDPEDAATDAEVAEVTEPDVPEVTEPDVPEVTELDAGPGPIVLPTTSWLQRSNLPKALAGMSFTAQGGKLFVAGGVDDTGSPNQSAFAYSIGLDGWTPTNPIPIARADCGGARVGPQLYTVGGTGSGGSKLDHLVRFNPGTGLWKNLQGIPDPGCCMAAVGFDDRLWVFGGRDGSDLVQSFWPAAGIWESHSAMPVGRSRHAAAVVNDAVVIIGGLTTDQVSTGQLVTAVDVYDPATDSWSAGPEAPFQRYDLAAAAWESQVWVFGGATPLGVATTDVWVMELGKGWVKAPTIMANARRNHRAVATVDGIFVLGGFAITSKPLPNLDLLKLGQ